MTPVRKFAFDRDFGAPERDPLPDRRDEAAEAAQLEAMLAAARAEGRAEGRREGRAEAEADHARRAADSLEAVARALTALAEAAPAERDALERQALDLAIAIARKAVPELAARNGLREIEAAVRGCIASLAAPLRIRIAVPAAAEAVLTARLEAVAAETGFAGEIAVVGDPHLGPGECRVDWPEGGAERRAARLWRELDAVLDRHLPGRRGDPRPDTEPSEENP